MDLQIDRKEVKGGIGHSNGGGGEGGKFQSIPMLRSIVMIFFGTV